MNFRTAICVAMLAAGVLICQVPQAAVTAEEAATLKTSLTPLGAERAGNKEGTIPAWEGGYTTPIPGFVNGGRRPDPFADEKPLFSITAKNMQQYIDRLNEGTLALLKKYPDAFRLDVYPTHRTAAAPEWVYENTFKNATRAKLDGDVPEGAFGGAPFPIPKTGAEVMWNHLLRWQGVATHAQANAYLVTSDRKMVLLSDASVLFQSPYYFQDAASQPFDGDHTLFRLRLKGPPIRAGEAFTIRTNMNSDKDQAWVYLVGQRRVRKLPNACCDTPNPAAAGVETFDEVNLQYGGLTRFDWKIIGKKEMYIPYNTNRSLQPTKDSDFIRPDLGVLNPDYVRWELHRVWVVEATLRPGQRHTAPKGRYYVDEDTWYAVLSDRWDGNGQLWKTGLQGLIVAPDLPGNLNTFFGFYDLVSGARFYGAILNSGSEQYKIMPRQPDSVFSPDGLAGQGVR